MSAFFVLGIVFVTLKLCHVIAWSWVWVLAPFWGPVAVWAFFACIGLFVWLRKSPLERAIDRMVDTLARRS